MSIDLLLRALRKCEQLPDSDDDRFAILIEDEWRVNQFLYEDRIRHLSILADKIHKKIVERFEKMMKAGRELYLDKIVREQEENLRHLGEEM